ncbi:hypothetical protein T484DRAFT_1975225 [Baffinella frigidus]|nr:hypothetical protein T484DRAFT_1975225 [Cryptophyta sp. CCMP2293]
MPRRVLPAVPVACQIRRAAWRCAGKSWGQATGSWAGHSVAQWDPSVQHREQ